MDASTTASCIVAVAVVIVYQQRARASLVMDVTIGLINSRNKIETIDNEDNNTDDHH